MQAEAFVSRILDDEGLIDGLDEEVAQTLVGWLVQRTERLAAKAKDEAAVWKQVEELCRRARTIRKLVVLYCQEKDQTAAADLAKSERLPWPLPDSADPHQVLQHVLSKEGP